MTEGDTDGMRKLATVADQLRKGGKSVMETHKSFPLRSIAFIAIVVILAALLCFAIYYGNENTALELETPTSEEIKQNGCYPVNENGETYGTYALSEAPDLILSMNSEGVLGYIRKSDLSPRPESIEEALEISGTRTELIMYYQDGVTPIGTFTLGSQVKGG